MAELFRALPCLLQEAFPDFSSQRPSSGELNPTHPWDLLPESLALLFPTRLRVFPGQGSGLLLLGDTLPPNAGSGIPLNSSAISEEPMPAVRGVEAEPVEAWTGGLGKDFLF